MTIYRKITQNEIHMNYFASFKHNQQWNRQWVKQDNVWVLKQIEGSRSWSFEKRVWISQYLKEQIHNGGFTIGAFQDNQIIAFVCVDGKIIDEMPDFTLLPGLAFSPLGFRIGYGGGYYDRFLVQNPHLKKIGLAYACQEVDAVPTEENDIPLDMVITENGIREF